MDDPRPLCVLLLDGVLEEIAFAQRAQDLLRAPGVVALEPGRHPAPGLMAAGVAKRVSRKLPGTPRVVFLVGPRQYGLARALTALHEGCELWYTPAPGRDDDLARERATLVVDPAGDNADLWARLEALEVRLG